MEQLKRLDSQLELREQLLSLCRLQYGEIWQDSVHGHRVGVLDATNRDDLAKIMSDEKTPLIINDPPYNVAVGSTNTKNPSRIDIDSYLGFSRKWVENALGILDRSAHSVYLDGR